MSIGKVILLCILFLYLTKVIGLLIHCDNCEGLESVRYFSYVIPLLEVIFWLYASSVLVMRRSKESFDVFRLTFKYRRNMGKLILLMFYTDKELRKEFLILFKMFKLSTFITRRHNRKIGSVRGAFKGLFGEFDALIDGQSISGMRALF